MGSQRGCAHYHFKVKVRVTFHKMPLCCTPSHALRNPNFTPVVLNPYNASLCRRFKAWIANLLRPYGATGASKEVINAAFLQYSMPPRKKKNGGAPRARGPAVMMQMLENKLRTEMRQSRVSSTTLFFISTISVCHCVHFNTFIPQVYCANDKFILRCKKSAKDTMVRGSAVEALIDSPSLGLALTAAPGCLQPRRSNTKNVLDILLTFGENGASKREIVTILRTKYGSLYECVSPVINFLKRKRTRTYETKGPCICVQAPRQPGADVRGEDRPSGHGLQ